MKKLVVLISNTGTGTNLQAIIDGIEQKKINASIVAVISDTEKALGLARAKKHHIPIEIVPKKDLLLAALQKYNPDYICLCGWKQFILDTVIDAYPNKIINLHPGLIPDKMNGFTKNPDGTKGEWNKGKLTDAAIGQVLDSKNTYAGSSIHFLTHEFDFGKVLGRCFEKVRRGDTIDSLYSRLKTRENKLYQDVLTTLTKMKKVNIEKGKTVLVIDASGRAAALVHKYSESPRVSRIISIPGNDTMQLNSKIPVKISPELKTTSVMEIVEIAKREKVDLVDVAQDNAVEAGVADALIDAGFNVIGPTRAAGQIEWDKAYARDFMKKYHLPIPPYHVFHSQVEAIKFIKKNPKKKWFIKASGLAEGKGAIPASNFEEATAAIKQMAKFGASGKTFVIEEWLEGEEFSMFALTDGKKFIIAGCAQDHKRLLDGDLGPNTGGMGCSTPPLIVSKAIYSQGKTIIEKTLKGLQKEDTPYKGVLYLGAIVVKNKVYIIEFNARWGSPEAEVLVPGITDDLFEIGMQISEGNLKKTTLHTDGLARVVVTGSLRPGVETKKRQLFGLENLLKEKDVIFYGTRVTIERNKYFVSSGRLFHIVASGKNVIEARQKAYAAMSQLFIEGNNLHFRTDIGWRDVERLRKQ